MFRKTILATVAATFAASISLTAYAADNVSGAFDGMIDKSGFDQFVEDSSFDVRIRMNHFDLSPHRGTITNNFTTAEAADYMSTLRTVDTKTLTEILAGFGVPDHDIASLLDNDTFLREFVNNNVTQATGGLQALNADIGNGTTAEVENEGDVRQGGIALWTHFKSGYLFDFIGFDLGTQNSKVLYNIGSGSQIAVKGSDGYLNKTMSRVSIANIKMRFGDEDRHIGLRKGKIQFNTTHFGRDPNEWLMDKSYEGAIINAKWDGLNVHGMEVSAFGDINSKKFIEIDDKTDFDRADFKKTNSLGAQYESDYGNFWTATTWSKNYMRSNVIGAESGIPLSLLGMDVPKGQEMDHMIVLSARHNWQKAEKDYVINGIHKPDHKATSSALMIGLNYDALFAGVSYLNTSKEGYYDAGIGGGGQEKILANEMLINGWNRPNQKTITGLLSYNWKNFGISGLSTSLISAHASNIDMKQVLKNGDVEYYLTGQESFHETLMDMRYDWNEGALKGLNMRAVYGFETNQASLKGGALFLTYDAVLF